MQIGNINVLDCPPTPVHGVHWRNDPWRIEESDFHKFALGKFDWVAAICYPNLPPELQAGHLDVYRRLREIDPGVKFLVRLNLSGPVKSSEFVAAFAPRLEELREFTDLFQIHNEPNHPGEHFGGSSDESAWRYRWWHQRVVEGLKETAPWARLGFPGLAVRQREEAWLDICGPAIDMSDFLGCHVYWQHDNWASPDWGGRYALFPRAFPDKDLYITEYGDSTPGRSATEKARIYIQWLRKIGGQGTGVGGQGIEDRCPKAACAFILSSSDEAWSSFSLDEEACAILGGGKG